MDLLESVSEPNSSELGVNYSDVSDIDENELVRDFEIDSDSEHSFNEELPADSEVEGEPGVEDDQQNLPVPGINAYIIHKANNMTLEEEKVLPRRSFLMNLGRQLILGQVKTRASPQYNIGRQMKNRIMEVFKLNPVEDEDEQPVAARR
ncbi:hypothetical protein J6590_013631 [Homalodisca vitripennis]|nr:hypothetical protein J6590_013631 [Homalodisca vitripennis]